METGSLAWFDFPTRDENKAMAFYKAVLGWQFEPAGPDYWMIKVGGTTIGGIRKENSQSFKRNESLVNYFTVPSVTEMRNVVTELGGSLIGESVAISNGEMGHFQMFTDLDGHLMALWSMKA